MWYRGDEHPAATEATTRDFQDRWYPLETRDGLVLEPTGAGWSLGEARRLEADAELFEVARQALTDDAVGALRVEAAEAGDAGRVAICDQALSGDERARAECLRVIDEAREGRK